MLWSSRKSGRKTSVRQALQALRSRVLADGGSVFCVVGPSIERRYFPSWSQADNFAADMASCVVGDSFFAQERRELDGVQCLVRSREWTFDRDTGLSL